jgi:hypothetical protein
MAGKKRGIRVGKKPRAKVKAQSSVVAVTPAREKKVRSRRAAIPGVPRVQMDWLNESNFVKLTLDPCNGPLAASPFGATENAYTWRLNFRQTVTANANGHVIAALYPLGIYNLGSGVTTAPLPLQVWGGSFVNDANIGQTSSISTTIPGAANLTTMAAQVRPIAGCVKLKYTGPANTAQGEMYAWEGQGDENFASVASSQSMIVRQSPQYFILNGANAPITSGVEAMLNYAKAPIAQTQYADPLVTHTDVYCPMAVVGVSGASSGSAFVVEGTIIVEWTPQLSLGMPRPNQMLLKPGAAERVANALKMAAPLLVRVGSQVLGGYAGMLATSAKFGADVIRAM